MATTLLHLSPKSPPASAPSFPVLNPPFSRPRFLPLRPIKTNNSNTKTISSYNTHKRIPIPLPSFPFSWASVDVVKYFSRLFATGASFALFVGLPVAWFGSAGPISDPVRPVLASVSSGILLVTIAVLRMYLGWAYVGNRLLSATVEWWYDGQIWVKTAEVLARDRLLGFFIYVKSVLIRLKYTLVTLAVSLLVCVLPLINVDQGGQESSYMTSKEARVQAIPGVYDDDSARSFEPDAFCGEPDLS
ncbi:hypothetical protein V6Z11_1Z040600 [Gossypium hirsutum]